MTSQTIPEPTRRLFLAAMEAEAKGQTGLVQAFRDLLRAEQPMGAIQTPIGEQIAPESPKMAASARIASDQAKALSAIQAAFTKSP